MRQLWAEIDQIIAEGTKHRRGYTLAESTFPATVEHMKEEVIELETSVTPEERINELGDVLAIVFHAAKQLGLSMEQLEAVSLAKLKMRFPGHEPKIVRSFHPPDTDNIRRVVAAMMLHDGASIDEVRAAMGAGPVSEDPLAKVMQDLLLATPRIIAPTGPKPE